MERPHSQRVGPDASQASTLPLRQTLATSAELRDLADSLPYLGWTCLASGPCDHLSRQWVEYTGIPEAEQLGSRWLAQIHPDDCERVKTCWAGMVDSAVAFEVEMRIRRADGVYRWFRSWASPVRDEGGAVLRWYGSNADVDDYKRTEARLLATDACLKTALQQTTASEAKYRTLFERSPQGILIADIETQAIRYANPEATALSGYTESELCALHVVDLAPPGEAERVLGEFASLVLGTKALTEGLPALRKDGMTMLLDVSGALVTVDDRPMAVCFFRDVTRRAQMELALASSEARYRRLFESAKDGILILDATSGRILDVNPYMTELTDYSREEFLEKHLWEIGPFKDVVASRVSFAELQAKDYVRYDDLPLKTRAGGTVDVEFVSNVYVVAGAKVIQCNIRNITERKRAEAERRLLMTAIEQSIDTVIITDAQGHAVYVNPAFERVSGYARSEALGRTPRLLKSGAQSDDFYRTLWATVNRGETWSGRFVNKRKDGTLYQEDAIVSPVRDTAGAITNYVGVQRDVTDALALQAQFLHAQKMEAVGRLAGGIAHDFNNALSVILCYAEMIDGDLKRDEPLRADVSEILKAALRASDLTRQLLAFSRRQVLELKVVNLNESLEAMERMVARLLGADVALTMLLGSDLWNVKADLGQVEQIVMNLAVNARDAMPEGGKLTIQTSNVHLDEEYVQTHLDVRAGAYVELDVTDTGTGMDAETRGRIFEPFFTTKDTGKGTGLGLATVFGIVHQSGGHIWVYSEPGQGATFKIYLPRFAGAAVQTSSKPADLSPERGSETILLVEDEDQLRILARNILRRHGYVVLDAPNGGEALLICEQHGAKIDLLLTDVVLPRMSGRQISDRLATMRPDMKVLFMSGYTNDAVLLHGVLDSGVAFLQKPFTPTSLTRKVREALDEKKGRSGG
jgi:PAS domain S-box-containing protein